MPVGVYHGRLKVENGAVTFDLPELPSSPNSMVVLHFNRTGQCLYFVRADDLGVFDGAETKLTKLPDHEDRRRIRVLSATERGRFRNFLRKGNFDKSDDGERSENLEWWEVIRRICKRIDRPQVDLEKVMDWLRQDYSLVYVDVPNRGHEL